MGINEEKEKEAKSSFNKDAYKHAIGMVESRGGKDLDNTTSSASGKYHFLYNSIKHDPSMEGVSKREFMNRPELQEEIMDKALAGELEGWTYGAGYADNLKSKYETNHDVNELTALTHYLGAGNVKKYLSDPEGFVVEGQNLTPQKYIENFRTHFDQYKPEPIPEPEPVVLPKGDNTERMQTIQPKESTFVAPKRMNLPMNKEGLAKMFDLGGEIVAEQDEMQALDGASKLVTLFEGGGTHEENPNGGIPQGKDLVEAGETKWNNYIFSNSYSLTGNHTGTDGKVSNVFEGGGKLSDPKKSNLNVADPIAGPQPNEGAKYPLTFTKTESQFHTKGQDMQVEDVREKYTSSPTPFKYNPEASSDVNFNLALQDASSQSFLDRYDAPESREMMKGQTNLTDYDIDNMILRGMNAKKEIGGNAKGSKASYDADSQKISMDPRYADNTDVETHERVHASGFDAAQGKNLMNVLGNSFQQEGRDFMKKSSPETLRYLNQPHEAYGNFVEFREKIGLKPGEKIDETELKKRVKASGAGMENFYRAFNDKNIVEALNTIAYTDNNKQSSMDDYRIT